MAAPVFRASTQSGSPSSGLDVPAGIQTGDLLIAFIYSNRSTGSGPDGWAQIVAHGGSTRFVDVYTRVVTDPASEPRSYSFTTDASFDSGVMLAYENAAVDVVSTVNEATTTAPTSPGITTTGPDETLLWACGVSNSVQPHPPSGFILHALANSVSPFLAVADATQAAAGATGTKTGSVSSPQVCDTLLVALKSAAPAFSGSFTATAHVSATFSGHDSTQIGGSFSATAEASLSVTGTAGRHGGFTATVDVSGDITGTAHLPFLGPTFAVEVALSGQAGAVVADEDWTDITEWVTAFTSKRGRATEIDELEAGELTLTLDNEDGRFTPGKATSPLYPQWGPRRPIRVRTLATDTTPAAFIFTGSIFDISVEVTADSAAVCTVSATDAVGALSRLPLTSPAQANILTLGPTALYPMTDGNAATEFGNVAPTDVPALTRVDATAGPGTIEGGGDTVMPGYPGEQSVTFDSSANSDSTTHGPGSGLTTREPACMPLTGPWSMHVWIAPRDNPPPVSQFVYEAGDHSDPSASACDVIWAPGTTNEGGLMVFWGGQMISIDGPFDDPIFMVALTLTADGTPKFYVNGALSGTATIGDTSPFVSPTSTVTVCTAIDLGSSTYSAFFSGQVGGLAFYDRELTADEIATLYANGLDGQSGETNVERVEAILDAAGWDESLRDLDADSVQMGPRTWAGGDNPFDTARTTGADSRYDVYASTDGKIAGLARATRIAAVSEATLSESEGTAVEVPLTVRITEDDIINDVTVHRVNGIVHRLRDTDSIADFGTVSDDVEVNLASDADAVAYGQELLTTYAQPHVRTGAVTMRVISNESWAAATSLDFGKRITLADLPASAPADSMDFFIESVTHDVTIEGKFAEWNTTFELSPVELYGAS